MVQSEIMAERRESVVEVNKEIVLEANRHQLAQRQINRIWELTQATIAILVTTSTLIVASSLATEDSTNTSAFILLSNSFFLVIGFYFGRTNHTRTGGLKE